MPNEYHAQKTRLIREWPTFRQNHMVPDLSLSHTGLVLGEGRRRHQHQELAELISTSIEAQQHHSRRDPRAQRRLLPDSGGSTAQDKPAPGSASDASQK